jgi:2-polyprenyl-6-methoxyphenol hydroxylase-like FAD-dependent oxidoreductase
MYDAIVIGARCAGSPTAMLLARKGYRVLLLDRAGFPSDTLSTHYIHQPGVARLKRCGLLERIVSSNCPPVLRQMLDVGPFRPGGLATAGRRRRRGVRPAT